MGCVAGKLSKKKLRKKHRQRNISVSASASNHMVALTSSTYGVLRVDSSPRVEAKCKPRAENQNQDDGNESSSQTKSSDSEPLKGLDGNSWVEKKVIEEENAVVSSTEDQPVTTINAWELMAGLEESPAKKCLEKQGSIYHTVEEIDARVSSNVSEKKRFGKENARPKQISTPSKVKSGLGLSSPLGEIDFNKFYSPENVGFHVASVRSKQRMRRPGSHGFMTDLKVATAKYIGWKVWLSTNTTLQRRLNLF